MIKLVAIDLDGTLLNDKKEVSLKNQEILAKAKEQGVKIVLCTGRPLMAVHKYLEELALDSEGDYSITFNGGLVQKNQSGEIMGKQTLTFTEVKELISMATAMDMPLDILSDEVVLSLPLSKNHLSIYSSLNPLLRFKATDSSELTEDRLYNKAVIAYDASVLDTWIPEIPIKIREKYEVIKTRSNLLEFMPSGVTKAYGIEVLAQELGIKQEEVMAIGDEENDLSMIAYAGVGVAMENATKEVKAAANYVTASNEKDGVAQAIEKFVLK